ncbi:hypothetical protein [Acinetobacter baumannii]|uniref:hypothetical protein n=1 Tax=Acinetobacter baumannii TaxID=470 RepID=UPI0015812D18|nr:hypothetical protein [Acinetobacter baumannii]NUG32780.1 hypothetical protein [Acinetobacter baumannii]
MKASKLIKDKGLQYAKEIVDSAPSNATEWNEGFEFQCGQSVEISKADREKYFVDLSDLKRLVESLEIIETVGYDRDGAEEIYEFSKEHEWIFYAGLEIKVTRLAQAIKDHESIYGGGHV